MDAFPKNIKALIEAQGITQQRFADSIGVSLTTVNGWLKRGVQPKRFNLDTICERYGVTHDGLLSGSDGIYAHVHGLVEAPAGASTVSPSPVRMVPVLGTTFAGTPDDPIESDGEAMLYDSIAANHPRCYALRVHGTCMDRVFTEADHIFVDPDMEPLVGAVGLEPTFPKEADFKSFSRRLRPIWPLGWRRVGLWILGPSRAVSAALADGVAERCGTPRHCGRGVSRCGERR